MGNRITKLGVELLESREVPAGDIAAYVSGGHLYVSEALGSFGKGQNAVISLVGNGTVRVTGGSSQDGGFSKVNGAAFKDFFISGDLKVELGGGNDTIYLAKNTGIMGIDINMTNATAVAATDLDLVYADTIHTNNQLNIRTGVGRDSVRVWDSSIGNDGGIYDNLTIDTGAGNDTVRVESVNRGMQVKGHVFVNTFKAAEIQTDKVTMVSVVAGRHIAVNTGHGNDKISLTNMFAGTDVVVSGGEGNDLVTLTEVRAQDDLWVYLGKGNDTLNIMYLNCDELVLNGEGGTDDLNSSVQGQSNTSSITGFEL